MAAGGLLMTKGSILLAGAVDAGTTPFSNRFPRHHLVNGLTGGVIDLVAIDTANAHVGSIKLEGGSTLCVCFPMPAPARHT